VCLIERVELVGRKSVRNLWRTPAPSHQKFTRDDDDKNKVLISRRGHVHQCFYEANQTSGLHRVSIVPGVCFLFSPGKTDTDSAGTQVKQSRSYFAINIWVLKFPSSAHFYKYNAESIRHYIFDMAGLKLRSWFLITFFVGNSGNNAILNRLFY
jgi:hypothetical protein